MKLNEYALIFLIFFILEYSKHVKFFFKGNDSISVKQYLCVKPSFLKFLFWVLDT